MPLISAYVNQAGEKALIATRHSLIEARTMSGEAVRLAFREAAREDMATSEFTVNPVQIVPWLEVPLLIVVVARRTIERTAAKREIERLIEYNIGSWTDALAGAQAEIVMRRPLGDGITIAKGVIKRGDEYLGRRDLL